MRKITRTNRPFLFSPLGLLLLAVVLVVAGTLFWWREPLAGALWRVATPLLNLRVNLGETENARLRAEVEALTAEAADRTLLYEENLYLKRLLGRNPGLDTVVAGVIMRPPGSPYDTLIIDAGDNAGLLMGNLVSAGGGALIGTISQVYAHTARVTLFSSPGEQYEALLRREGEVVIPLTLVGQGSGALSADVPAGTGVMVGERVIVPGLGSGLAAVVSAVEVEDSRSFERVHLHLPANAQNLRFVEVWRSTLSHEQ